MLLPFARNWRDKVSQIKAGPNFGIHGTNYENAVSIMNSRQNWIMAHYLRVGEKEKLLEDRDFYAGLIPSIDVALKFTLPEHPTFILGIQRGKYHLEACQRGASMWGRRESFPIGEDFYKWAGIDLKMVEITPEEVLRLSKGKYKISEIDNLGREFFMKKKLLCAMVGKIAEALQ